MIQKISLLVLLLATLHASQTFAQSEKIDVTVHSRVDTGDSEVQAVADLWVNYLNSTPDSLYDNPYWNKEEKLKFSDFDLSRVYLYPFSSNQLLLYFKPTILSIEKEGEHYAIRTIFAADNLDGDYRKSNPWCITKLYAIKEEGEWKLKNALPILTQNWKRTTIGKITFIYPPEHTFNQDLAKKASDFCDQVTQEFNFSEWKPFDFYITKSGDELGKLVNFDFYFAGYTTGIGMNERRILLSGFGSEFYPHEFIHLIVPKFDRHALIEEGFATWKGGQGGKTFEESARIFANELALNDTVNFSDVLYTNWGWHVAAFYTTGAIFCKAAYDKGGVSMVNLLLKVEDSDENFAENCSTIFGIKKEAFDSFWRKEVLKYKNP